MSLETVWHGEKHVYLFAHRDDRGCPLPPFAGRLPEVPELWELPPEGKIIEAVRACTHPVDVTQIASLARTSGQTTRRVVDALLSSGVMRRAQPDLFDLAVGRGELYQVVGR